MKLEALGNNIVLQPIKADSKTKGGIQMPDQFRARFEDGCTVISVGPDAIRLVPNDIVIRPDPPRVVVTDDTTGEEFWLAEEGDILAKVIG